MKDLGGMAALAVLAYSLIRLDELLSFPALAWLAIAASAAIALWMAIK